MNILYVLIVSLVLYIVFDFVKKNRKLSKNDPPGFNYSLPIVGDIHQIGTHPHRKFVELENKFQKGIFKLWMGNRYTVVITDVDMMNELFVKKGNEFLNRPKVKSFSQWSYNGRGLVMARDDDWRRVRKLVSGAFSKTKVSKISGLIEDQTKILMDSLNQHANQNKPFYPKALLSKFTLNVIGNIFFSKDVCSEQDLEDVNNKTKKLFLPIIKVFESLGVGGQLDDFIPFLVPFSYFKRAELQKSIDEIYYYMKEIYDDHLKNIDWNNPKDLMDILIIDTNDERLTVHTAMDFLLGGSHTSETSFQYFLLHIVNQPHIQRKLYEEIISVVGEDCEFITTEYKNKLPYLNACIKEVLRIVPVTPLSVPRTNDEDAEIGGYFIPKGTQIIPNLYGVSNLEKYVERPSEYIPERWLDDSPFKTKHDESQDKYYNNLSKVSIPFSLGIRGCPAFFLAEDELFLSCSNSVLNFKFESFDGNPIEITEMFGLTLHPKPYNLRVIKRR